MSVRCIKDRGLSTGSSCTSDSQCSSGYCPSAAPRVCKVPTGNSCIGSSETEKNTNCAIGNCDFDGYCRGKAGATCSQNTDCSTGTSCVSGYCMVSYTLIQTNNSAVTPQPPNALTGGFNNVAVADPVEVNPAGAGGQDGDARLYFVPPVMCPGDYLHGDCSGGMWYCDVYTNALPCNSMSACTWTNIPYVCGGNQYRTSGSYNSFLDAGASTASWRTVQVTKGNSASTDGSVRVQVKVSNSGTTAPTFDATGVNCDFTVSSNGSSGNKDLTTCSNLGTGRYLWYKATFSSPANTRTPTLMDFSATLFSTAAPIPQAKISLSTSTLNFASMINSEPAPQTAVVQNSGTATLNWTASSTQSWCRITSATSGQLIPGATTTLTVSPTALSSTNSYICDVSVTDSSASNSPQKIRVNYTVQSPLAVINLSTSNLYFYSVVNSIPSSQGVTIKNNGIQNQLVWSANPNQSWCAASPSSGTLSPGASSLVSISVGSFSTGGTRSCQISFSDNNASNSPQPLSVSYSVSTCGNGSVEPGEDCEPGQTSDCCSGFQTCSSSCTWQTNTCNNSCTACNSCDANSCPFLYAYNGSEYKFQTDIVSAGKLGYRGNPKPVSDDYFLFPASEMKSVNGNYSIIIKEERNEVDYLDMVKFYYIDHDPVISVYADNIRENQARMSTDMPLFTVNTNTVRLPISCTYNDYNCLEDIKKIDGIYTVPQKYWTWNKMTLDFGDLSGENTIKLVLRGFQIPPSSPGTPVFDEKIHGPRPKNHYKLEIIDKNGSWKEVDTKYITINPAEAVRTYVADLSGIFESDDYRIRISYIFDDRFDYVALDTSANTPIEVKELKLAKAELSATKTISYLDFSKFPIDYQYNDPFIKPIYKYYYSGYFTKLGDITPLLEKTDDKFAILNVADEIKLEIQEPPKLEEGKVRTILIHSNGFYKTSMYGIVDSTVDPLPFQKMTKYPYSTSTENYPYGSEHIEYLKEWNTRYCESGKDKCYAKERADL